VTIYRTFGSIRKVPVAAQKAYPGMIATGKSSIGSGSMGSSRRLAGGGSVARPLVLSEMAAGERNDSAGKTKVE
jgi:hypothetical protein